MGCQGANKARMIMANADKPHSIARVRRVFCLLVEVGSVIKKKACCRHCDLSPGIRQGLATRASINSANNLRCVSGASDSVHPVVVGGVCKGPGCPPPIESTWKKERAPL